MIFFHLFTNIWSCNKKHAIFSISACYVLLWEFVEWGSFSNETSNFVKTMGKSHKITSYLYDKSKILGPKIWSQGTNLGYLGPWSQVDLDRLFSKPQILFILNPNSFSELVACRVTAKNPNFFPWQCDMYRYLCKYTLLCTVVSAKFPPAVFRWHLSKKYAKI